MRLEISCKDRLGITQDVLDILVRHEIDLRGIDIDPVGKIFLNFPELAFEEFQHLMPEIRRIEGVDDVKTTSFLPSEREHFELTTLLRTLPDAVFSIDQRGKVLLANEAAQFKLSLSEEDIQAEPISHWLKGFSFSKWLEGEEVLAQTHKLKLGDEDHIADILPIMVPGDNEQVLAGAVIILKSELRLGQQVNAFRQSQEDSFGQLIGSSSSLRRVVREAKKMAILDAPILIMGETGTGKELLARACHAASGRKDKPFLALNCASLPDSVAESELFGYGPNAFESGAPEGKRGIFEQANGGTVFLDEVGEMSAQLQTKLVRFLQDGTFRRIADEREVNVDIRIICATQKDLPEIVQDGQFREDLFYRLNVLSIRVPSLRERKADIPSLANHFVRQRSRRIGRTSPPIAEDCMLLLQNYPWPGNVRQLENALYRAVSLLDGDVLEKSHIQLPSYSNDMGYLEEEFEGTLEEAVKRYEASILRKLYPAYPSTRQLSKKLGLSHTAIANKLREYGINRKTVKV